MNISKSPRRSLTCSVSVIYRYCVKRFLIRLSSEQRSYRHENALGLQVVRHVCTHLQREYNISRRARTRTVFSLQNAITGAMTFHRVARSSSVLFTIMKTSFSDAIRQACQKSDVFMRFWFASRFLRVYAFRSAPKLVCTSQARYAFYKRRRGRRVFLRVSNLPAAVPFGLVGHPPERQQCSKKFVTNAQQQQYRSVTPRAVFNCL